MGADAVSHGATGKGNDQVRFELGYYGLKPNIKVIAPWREWDLNSRTKLMQYAHDHQIPIPADKAKLFDGETPHAGEAEAPFSMDANLLHVSYEGNALEDPWVHPNDVPYRMTVAPEDAPDTPEEVEIEFEHGDAVAINGIKMSPAAILTKLNELGGTHGVGRIDIVENRYVGMKSRGIYETPGGTILLAAHRGMESMTLDRGAAHMKDEIMPKYSELIYNGYWFSSERRALQAMIDQTQEQVSGVVRVKLYKGNAMVVGRKSPFSLYSEAHVTFEEDEVYNQRDAEGFIKINSLRLRLANKG
jgi:argininosuccinate synthase